MTAGLRSPEPVAAVPECALPSGQDRIARIERLVSPRRLHETLPLGCERAAAVAAARQRIRSILDGEDHRLLVVVGPCSVHDPPALAEYARRLLALSREWHDALYLTLRVYFEKPRTTTGWTGLLNDPGLDGSGEVDAGLRTARALLLDALSLGLPTACEFLDPIIPQYLSDAVCWAAIGARTAESQIHRRLASGLPMPVGFKNRTDGNVQVAVDAVRTAAAPHAFTGVDHDGSPAIVHTRGNRDCHVILRGGPHGPNHHAGAVADLRRRLRAGGLPARVMIDLSHGNSGKDPERQPVIATEVAGALRGGEPAIVGTMIESFLVLGRQDPAAVPLRFGQSVTDGCLGLEATAEVLEELAGAARARCRAAGGLTRAPAPPR
jgi:3-deoxy-7-phosphoheptulonate synthase